MATVISVSVYHPNPLIPFTILLARSSTFLLASSGSFMANILGPPAACLCPHLQDGGTLLPSSVLWSSSLGRQELPATYHTTCYEVRTPLKGQGHGGNYSKETSGYVQRLCFFSNVCILWLMNETRY